MTTWERLEKYGHIKNYKRAYDNESYYVELKDGLIYITNLNGKTYKMTIDTFLYLWPLKNVDLLFLN